MKFTSTFLQRISLPGLVVIILNLATVAPAAADPIVFETMGASWFAGPINSTWVQVKQNAFGPGHGLLSLSDLNQALAIAATNPNDHRLLGTYTGTVDQINFADDVFTSVYDGTNWDTNGALPPLFAPGDNKPEDDWGVRFSGAINIENAGWYNFGVLSDDGFAFALAANGNIYPMSQDGLNPRERYGFPQDLYLQSGHYNFTLDAYEHLEAGVISLGVWHDVNAVPAPASGLLVLAGVGCVAVLYRRNRASITTS